MRDPVRASSYSFADAAFRGKPKLSRIFIATRREKEKPRESGAFRAIRVSADTHHLKLTLAYMKAPLKPNGELAAYGR
jgi:hypothetical protein